MKYLIKIDKEKYNDIIIKIYKDIYNRHLDDGHPIVRAFFYIEIYD